MKILETKIMRGPNYWSNYHKQLIVTKIDIEELEERPTNTIKGFAENLENLMPSLYVHRCSRDYEGGFFERLREGTWMGHVIEHIALELQCIAGMEAGFGRTRGADGKGIYNVVISYQIEKAGLYAMEAAIDVAMKLYAGESCNVDEHIQKLKDIKLRYGKGPSTQSIINEALRRGIPVRSMEKGSLIMLGQGVHQKMIRASMTCNTSSLGVEAACDKEDTKSILSRAYIPVPEGKLVYSEEELKEVINELGFPLVLKPLNGNHGRGITTNINNEEKAAEAFRLASQISKPVIAERYFEGEDYRLLVINYKLVAAARRTPAMVIGNGKSTVRELIDEANLDPRRGEGHEKVLTSIKIDEVTMNILREKNLSPEHILSIGTILYLKDTANLSTGGTSTDVTDVIPADTKFLAERVAKHMKLDICGIDLIAKDITQPIDGINGAVLEVNACPGFRMHLAPSKGLARNVAEPVIDMLFPAGSQSRIPIIAVTGTNGKTTTTRLTAHLASVAGYKTGFTSTDGIYVQGRQIHEGDCTGSQSATTILSDPTVDFAVLECARGGILRNGLGFDHCDISIITNVSDDHIGLKGINSLCDMARVKEVVARSTFDHGYAILNADDDLVYNMRENLDCNIALFSTDPHNERIKQHSEKGGLSATIEKGQLTICKGEWKIRVCRINSIPLTVDGKADCMIKNILPATLAAILSNFRIEDIRLGLQTFTPSPEHTPGRMNIFHFRNFHFMIDYAHNPAGFQELKNYMSQVESRRKVGIIAAVGDRREQEIVSLGQIAAEIFDKIIIRHDEDLRGRSKEEINALLLQGLKNSNREPSVQIISDEIEAIQNAIDNGETGDYIVLCTDAVKKSTQYVQKRLKEEKETFHILDSILAQNKT